ncbi:MAG: methyltransferase [Gammaproteobacteria bacterium]|nr:methyltransferase [Gammaproteobacteria bacterium]
MPEPHAQISPDTINRLMGAVYSPIAMLAGMQLELFTPLAEAPMSTSALAAKLGVRPEKLSPLLYALVVAELLTVEDGLFANTPESDQFLVKGSQNYLGGSHELLSDLWNAVLQTEETIRTGKPQALHDYKTMSDEALRAMLRGLHGGAIAFGRALIKPLDLSRYKHLVDVGGGSGGLAIGICQSCDHLQATIIDLPKTAAISEEFIAEAGMSKRITVNSADVTCKVPQGNFDIAILRSFIQVLSADQAQQAISNIGEAIESGGIIAIIGRMVDDSRLAPPDSVSFNLVFLNIYDEGCCYTQSEHRAWLP